MFEGLFRPGHLLIILAIVLVLYGPRNLPQVGAALGKTIRDFKNAMKEQPAEPSAAPPAKAERDPATDGRTPPAPLG